ncbi:hypothetical protein MMC12_003436 [Toensbergia leucococca]|nr:hypothetical protein [Toensbergia leucococca]
MELPTLDLSVFINGNDYQRALWSQQLLDVCKTYGFFKLKGHGLQNQTMSELFERSRQFFDLPDEIKAKAKHPPRPNPHRGWSPQGQEKLAGITGFQKGERAPQLCEDIKETFDQGPRNDPLFPNIWPAESDIPGFRPFMETLFEAFHSIHMNILHSLELSLQLPPSRLSSLCSNNHTELRLTHYPPIDVSRLKDGKTSRISEHTDFGSVTLLLQDSTGGLEVEDQSLDGSFIPIESKDKTEMVVNIGDTLQRWTNDTLRSANHRVTIPVGMKERSQGTIPPRLSVAFFGKANRDASLRCLPEFAHLRTPLFDEDVTALDYNQRMVEKTYPLESTTVAVESY